MSDLSVFETFQKEEYAHIAQAHFKTNESISSFFKYYLVVAALPVSALAAYVSGMQKNLPMASSGGVAGPAGLSGDPKIMLAWLSLMVGVVGLCLCLYLIQLRFDVLLYARQVNLIRRFFYDRADGPMDYKSNLRLLPVSANAPRYFELYFLPVIFAFAVVDAAYATLFPVLISGGSGSVFDMDVVRNISISYWLIPISIFIAHPILYFFNASSRENGYLHSTGIGVDIDGVLNNHENDFSETFNRLVGRKIDPIDISLLPVHRVDGLGVSECEERKVFCDFDYWANMQPMDGAAKHLSEIKRLGLKVYVVTSRPWPYRGHGDEDFKLDERLREWKKSTCAWLSEKIGAEKPIACLIDKIRCVFGFVRPIELVTKNWLRINKIPFDKFLIQGGGSRLSHRVFGDVDRVSLARKNRLKFFVEDDLVNARKLAYVCDFVFLIEHPYNHNFGNSPDLLEPGNPFLKLPANIIRVNGWSDIYQIVRRLV